MFGLFGKKTEAKKVIKDRPIKAGDKVKCVGDHKGDSGEKGYRGYGWEKGRVFVVTSVGDNVAWGPKEGGVYLHSVEHVD